MNMISRLVLAACQPFAPTEPMQLTFVMRNDLNMRKGKGCSQAGHIGIDLALRCLLSPRFWVWQLGHRAKITLKVKDEEELRSVKAAAEAAGLKTYMVQDAGKTEFKEPTYTSFSIAPATKAELEKVTGDLDLW